MFAIKLPGNNPCEVQTKLLRALEHEGLAFAALTHWLIEQYGRSALTVAHDTSYIGESTPTQYLK